MAWCCENNPTHLLSVGPLWEVPPDANCRLSVKVTHYEPGPGAGRPSAVLVLTGTCQHNSNLNWNEASPEISCQGLQDISGRRLLLLAGKRQKPPLDRFRGKIIYHEPVPKLGRRWAVLILGRTRERPVQQLRQLWQLDIQLPAHFPLHNAAHL